MNDAFKNALAIEALFEWTDGTVLLIGNYTGPDQPVRVGAGELRLSNGETIPVVVTAGRMPGPGDRRRSVSVAGLSFAQLRALKNDNDMTLVY